MGFQIRSSGDNALCVGLSDTIRVSPETSCTVKDLPRFVNTDREELPAYAETKQQAIICHQECCTASKSKFDHYEVIVIFEESRRNLVWAGSHW